MPKFTMARQYDKVSTQVHVNSAPFLTMYEGEKTAYITKNSIHWKKNRLNGKDAVYRVTGIWKAQ